MEKKLKLINVNKTYKLSNKETFQALYDINIEFDKGELISIIGESGSGKSTLMNLIGGLDSDFEGQIISGGENLEKLTDKQLDKYRKNKIGFVFQSFNLISHLSILDNVTLALTLSNVSEKERIEKATEMLKKVGLEHQLKKKPTQLSGGQKQRVAIARALINDPEIIIADEPTGALDSTTSMQILQILKQIADSGKLVIMVTHSEKVAKISSRVVEISDGRIVSDHINENYCKEAVLIDKPLTDKSSNEEVIDLNKLVLKESSQQTQKKKKKKNSKDNQNLSLWSAIRLSFHNMWASRIKNFLMAFGVAIGIGSLILMMSFSSGITDYINKTMKSYSDPTIVTITKKGNANDMASMMSYKSFGTEEIEGLEAELKQELGLAQDDNETLTFSYGVQMMTMFSYAKVIYNPDNLHFSYFDQTLLDQNKLEQQDKKENGEAYSEFNYANVVYMYTTPPYYTDTNIMEGEMSTSSGGIMFSSSIKKLFEDQNIFNEDGTSKKVDIAFTYTGENGKSEITFHNQEITGIVDTSVLANMLVMYIDYDYFQTMFQRENSGKSLEPNTVFIKTDSEETTNKINAYLAENHPEYSGAVEEQMARLFTNMSSIIGTSLIVISGISLVVSAMMILVVLYMSVTERTKEIGVLKSIGARRKDIKRIFTSESLLIGILSGVVGIIFSLMEALIIWLLLSNIIGLAPISFRWWYFAIAMGVSIIISMLSGLYPASKAAKLDPVESLRRE